MTRNKDTSQFKAIPTRPCVFRGSLAVNYRSLASGIPPLLGLDRSGRTADAPIGIPELVAALRVIENIVMSNKIYVDGSLPRKDLEKLGMWDARVQDDLHHSLDIRIIHLSRHELYEAATESAESASLMLNQIANGKLADSDRKYPDADDFDMFCKDIEQGAQLKTQNQRKIMSQEILDKVHRERVKEGGSYRGAKCVAGIIGADLTSGDPLSLLAQGLRPRDERAMLLAGAMIDRFRINYVNAIATYRHAAYLADSSIENLKSAQVALFWKYIVSQLGEKMLDAIDASAPEQLDQSFFTVPLGVAILINCNKPGGEALIEEACKIRSRRMIRSLAKDSPQSRYLHEMSEEEYEGFSEYLFCEKLRRLNSNEQAGASLVASRYTQLPVILGAAAGGALGAWATSFAGTDIQKIAAGAVGGLGGVLTSSLFSSVSSMPSRTRSRMHVDGYAKMKEYFNGVHANPVFGDVLATSVERVLGRTLQRA